MKRVLVFVFVICGTGLLSCSRQSQSLSISVIRDSQWLFYNFGECQDIYSFQDSTFQKNSCEIGDIFEGSFWVEKDTLFLLIPYPEKVKAFIGGDSVEIYKQGGRTYRPTLEKFIYRSDTLFFSEVYHSYGKPTQRKLVDFEINHLIQMGK
jgi:hypothetical protein